MSFKLATLLKHEDLQKLHLTRQIAVQDAKDGALPKESLILGQKWAHAQTSKEAMEQWQDEMSRRFPKGDR